MQSWRRLLSFSVVFALILAGGIRAQSPALNTETTDQFAAYTGCVLSDGLAVVGTTPLRPGVTTRTFATAKGSVTIPLTAGMRLMFAYPHEHYFANVKVEFLPEEGYTESKKEILSNFEYVLASGGIKRNQNLPSTMNGFEIQGMDTNKLNGGPLGMYLLFDEKEQGVITFYFLNTKRFKNMEEYAAVRDRFLNTYTGCIRERLKQHP